MADETSDFDQFINKRFEAIEGQMRNITEKMESLQSATSALQQGFYSFKVTLSETSQGVRLPQDDTTQRRS